MSYNFSYKRSINELAFYYVLNPASSYQDWALHEVMKPAFKVLNEEYGIEFLELAFGELPDIPEGVNLAYVIYGPTNPLALSQVEKKYLAALAKQGCETNVMATYPLTKSGKDSASYAHAKTLIPELCRELGINVVFADHLNIAVGARTIDWQDLRDNVIGETFRVKYHPSLQDHDEDKAMLQRLHEMHAPDIARLAEIHEQYRLWQRAPTDGSILFTHDGYWYSSQTKTNKLTMTPENYSLITSFDEGRRAVSYVGSRLPSSDAPEYLQLSTLMSMDGKRPKLIVHFHHYELTRGNRYRHLVTEEKLEYGQFMSGRHCYRKFNQAGSDWLIILEHGILWVGESVDAFESYIKDVISETSKVE